MDGQKKSNKKITKFLNELLFQLDFFSQPLGLTYKAKTNFSTRYGVILTIITFILIFLVMIDNLIISNNSYSFSYQSSLTTSASLNIDFKVDAGIFITLEDKNGSLLSCSAYLQGNLTLVNMNIDEVGNYFSTNDETILKLSECGSDAFLTSQLSEKYRGKALCISNTPDKSIYISNIYTSRFYITLKTNPKTNYTDLITGGYLLKVWSNEKTYSNSTYYDIIPSSNNVNLTINPQLNTYFTNLGFKKTTIYSGYFDVRSEYRNYYFTTTFKANQIEKVTKGKSNETLILNLEINIPVNVDELFYQNENQINSVSIIAGYMFLFYSVVRICVKKCADFKLYESICNETFNLISPDKMADLIDSDKAMKEKLIS